MKFLERKEIDVERWDSLAKGDIFSQSIYLDSVAENWGVLVDANYQEGIAIAYTIRLGVRAVYVPIFSRHTTYFGGELTSEVINTIQNLFSLGDLVLGNPVSYGKAAKMYQVISPNMDWRLNSQAKRMLKKFDKAHFSLEESVHAPGQLFRMIESDLQGKADGVKPMHVRRLEQLADAFEKNGKLTVSIVRSERGIEGGALFLQQVNEVVYLKSAFTPHAKKNGAMYACMSARIQEARMAGKSFDFGGSSITGVRTFNHNLGGVDCFLNRLKWDKSPWWFRLAKSLKR